MKKDSTESAAIISLINKLAICNDSVSFKLIVDNKTVLNTNGNNDLLQTVYSVLGGDIAESMVEVCGSRNNYSIYGYIGLPNCNRSNRNYQFIYINNRLVKSATVNAAIDRAYKNLLMNGKYAVLVLKINVPLNSVDVNVHPTKMEVKFKDEQYVFELVYYTLKNILAQERKLDEIIKKDCIENIPINENQMHVVHENSLFKADFVNTNVDANDTDQNKDSNSFISDITKIYDKESKEVFPGTPVSKKNVSINFSVLDKGFDARKVQLEIDELSNDFKDSKKEAVSLLSPELPIKYIGELFKTYIVIECGFSFYLVDKHAAHERILFNKIYDEYLSSERYVQEFICALPITLSPEEADFVRLNKDTFEKLGYIYDEFGDTDILLRAVPYVLSTGDAIPAFMELVNILSENINETMTEIENKNIRMLSCKAAIKAGYDSSDDELKQFIRTLLNESNANYCPHGRPIYCEFTKESIEKAFKRIV